MKTDTYYLVQNLMYNCTHIVKHRWYHRVFGKPSLSISECEAVSKVAAGLKFKYMGFTVGLGF